MKIHILSIFPESFESYFESSIMKRAQEKWHLSLMLHSLRDYSLDKTKRVDDKAFGMHGQVLTPEPLFRAIEHIYSTAWGKIPTICMTPSWQELTQIWLEQFKDTWGEEILILCGHYEGIDQRVIDTFVDERVSIGPYVVSSGEITAMVLIDALTRLIPWVLGNEESYLEESFSQKLNRQKEYPVYTKPRVFQGLEVPAILYSWNHQEIEKWKQQHLQ